jgi:hypothetical protein
MAEPKCREYGERPGCLGTVDERYTMRFDDIGEEPLYWCASCGPKVQEMALALDEALKKPGFAEKLKQAVHDVQPTEWERLLYDSK